VLALLGPGGPLGSLAPQPGSAGSLALIVVAHVSYELIIVVAIVGARLEALLEALPSAQLETARTLGAGAWRRGAAVVLPQILPAVAGAAALVFLLTAGSLGVVLVLGGPRWATLDAEVWYLGTQLLDLRGAAILALVQAGFVAVVGVAYATAGRRSWGVVRWDVARRVQSVPAGVWEPAPGRSAAPARPQAPSGAGSPGSSRWWDCSRSPPSSPSPDG